MFQDSHQLWNRPCRQTCSVEADALFRQRLGAAGSRPLPAGLEDAERGRRVRYQSHLDDWHGPSFENTLARGSKVAVLRRRGISAIEMAASRQ
ncbi:hypothetical protein CDD83_10025 [Cordyceps sp. RAO-2017]|nr:hypothetical protein CDD83_10025 [Cordyceps sp. RAO-2017]